MPMIKDTMLKRLLLPKLAAGGGGSAPVQETATGNPMTFLTDLAKPLKSLLIPFSPVQSGTGDPSPDNIRPILPWDGLTVNHAGKNLFDVSVMSTRTGVTVEGNTFVGSPYNFRGNGSTIPLKIPKGAKITLSLTANIESSTDGAGFAILFDYSDGTTARPFYTRNSEVEPTYHYGTITAEKDVVGYEFAYYNHSDEIWTVKDVQIEIGQTATAYEPYKPITEHETAFASPIYGGTLDVVSGVLTVEWARVKISDLDWQYQANWNGRFRAELAGKDGADASVSANLMCDCYKSENGTNSNNNIICGYGKGNSGLVYIKDSRFTGKDDFVEAVGDYYIYYPLLIPQTVQLAPEQITAIKGQNTIWSDADGQLTAVFLKKAQ